MKWSSVLIIVFAAGFAAGSRGEDSKARVGAIPLEGYELFWSAEFDGEKLDMTKWDYRNPGPRRKAINVKDTVSLDGKGNLVLTTRRVDDEIHTAMIGTQGKFETKFGYFECRVKMQKSHGHWSAFWLQSPTLGQKIGDPETSGTEIDIYECFTAQKNWVAHNIHWDGYGEHHKHAGSGPVDVPNLSDGYHTFGLEWTPDKYKFYVDGKMTWQTEQAVSHTPEYIILSLEVDAPQKSIIDKQGDFSDSVCFDYVRVYKKARQAE